MEMKTIWSVASRPAGIVEESAIKSQFCEQMDFMVKKVFDPKTKQHHYQDFISGEGAWEQSVSCDDST